MAEDGRSIKHTYTYETPTEVAIGVIGLLSSIRESGAALLTKHLDNEATRLRIREIELQADNRKNGPCPVG